MILNDKSIRASLVARLAASSKKSKAIIEELRVHNGNAIADVVTVGNFAHCYEIKGETDSIYRLAKQGHYYDLAFLKTTLVTTPNQLNKAMELVPLHWGMMVSTISNDRMSFRYIRSAGKSPNYDAKSALMTLWRSELIDMADSVLEVNVGKLNRDQLATLLIPMLGKAKITQFISDSLARRQRTPYV